MPVYTYKKVVSISRDRLVILCKEKTVSISFADVSCIHGLCLSAGDNSHIPVKLQHRGGDPWSDFSVEGSLQDLLLVLPCNEQDSLGL